MFRVLDQRVRTHSLYFYLLESRLSVGFIRSNRLKSKKKKGKKLTTKTHSVASAQMYNDDKGFYLIKYFIHSFRGPPPAAFPHMSYSNSPLKEIIEEKKF